MQQDPETRGRIKITDPFSRALAPVRRKERDIQTQDLLLIKIMQLKVYCQLRGTAHLDFILTKAIASPESVAEVEDRHLGAWLVSQFKSDLFHVHRDTRAGKDKRPHLRVNLAGLNRMRMRKLQVKLVQKVIHMRYQETEPEGWEELLAQYSEFLVALFSELECSYPQSKRQRILTTFETVSVANWMIRL